MKGHTCIIFTRHWDILNLNQTLWSRGEMHIFLTFSLPQFHLKTTSKNEKFEILKTGIQWQKLLWKISMHTISTLSEIRSTVKILWKILFMITMISISLFERLELVLIWLYSTLYMYWWNVHKVKGLQILEIAHTIYLPV